MKRGTPMHPKMMMLAGELTVPRYAAVGLMESVWHWAAQYAKDGDLGRYTPGVIAKAIEWEGDPDSLLAALIKCRWVDVLPPCERGEHAGPVHYLHDWHDHAEDAVQMSLARAARFFANGVKPKTTKLGKNEKAEVERAYKQAAQCSHGVGTKSERGEHCLSLGLTHNNAPGGAEAEAEPAHESNAGNPAPPPADPEQSHGDALDQRIRQYLGQHRGVNYSPIGHGHVRAMVEKGSWEQMAAALDAAVAAHADEPFSYARKVFGNAGDKAKLKAAATKFPEPLTKAKVHLV